MTQMPPPAQEPTNTPPAAGRPGELLDRFLARLIDGLVIGVVYGILSAIFRPLFLQGSCTPQGSCCSTGSCSR